MRKLCFVTTTRADYGLLKRLLKLVATDKELKLQLIVTGTHLSAAHGKTISEITADGIPVDYEIPIYDGGENTQAAFALGVKGFTEAFAVESNFNSSILCASTLCGIACCRVFKCKSFCGIIPVS